MKVLVKRLVRNSLLSIVGLILFIYVIVASGLVVLEQLVDKETQGQEAVYARSRAPHTLRHYDSGPSSLHRRLELIRGAKRSIELEFFIFDIDEASRLITQELIKKAAEGVRVRILVDFSAPVFQLKPIYARFLKSNGVDVRYYNTSSALRIVSSQHRSHRKLLMIDGETALTGGRNIANEYFDLNSKHDFLDSDIEISGASTDPVLKTVLSSFNLYWSSRLSEDPEHVAEKLSKGEYEKAVDFFLPGKGDEKWLSLIANRASPSAAYACNDLTFVTDFPNHGERNRKVFLAIVEALNDAKKTVSVESPYFVIREGGWKVLDSLRGKGLQVEVLTNGLHSTDASYAVAALAWRLGWIAKTGLTLRAFDGRPVDEQSTDLGGQNVRWALHSKRAVLDGTTTLIGTYNIDPRSANLNSEMMVICRDNPELAQAVAKSIERRMQNSVVVIDKGQLRSRSALIENSSWDQLLSFALTFPVANLFDFLL